MLATIGVIVGAIIVTSGLGVPRYDLYMRAASANDLTQDTRVLLQGLPVGRVRAIYPAVDTLSGQMAVLAKLSIERRFRDGTELSLPSGTRAVIVQRNPIASPVVELVLPNRPPGALLQPNDTIDSDRPASVIDVMSEMALELRTELTATLQETRTLLTRSTTAVEQTNAVLTSVGPPLQDALQNLASALDRTDQLLADLGPRVVDLSDSVAVALADARHILHTLDSLTLLGQQMASENRDAIRNLVDHLHRSAAVLEHFTDKVSRRPLRLFTGVTPPPDTMDLHP